jgi:hypothetical protein
LWCQEKKKNIECILEKEGGKKCGLLWTR